MDELRNILVLMDRGEQAQPAFDAALLLARRLGARLELLMTDYQDLRADYFTPAAGTFKEFRDSAMAAHRAVLERYAARAAAEGVPTLCEALWGTPSHEIVLARVEATQPDLVVKHSVHHNVVERTLFTGSDWHLIRECPTPLLLVKEPVRFDGAPVLACVDPQHSHDKPAVLDRQLLGTASMLAATLGGELHALHAFSIPVPVTVVGDAYVAAAALPVSGGVESASEAFTQLTGSYAIPPEHAHFMIGSPAREIRAQAARIGAGLVVMGAVSRSRLDRWFVGSTAESVLDRLGCSVWICKPPKA